MSTDIDSNPYSSGNIYSVDVNPAASTSTTASINQFTEPETPALDRQELSSNIETEFSMKPAAVDAHLFDTCNSASTTTGRKLRMGKGGFCVSLVSLLTKIQQLIDSVIRPLSEDSPKQDTTQRKKPTE